MVHYRRNRVPGGTYFFTVALRNRRSDLLTWRIDALRQSWQAASVRIPHEIIAAVVLPDHLHAVIAMPDCQVDYSRLWQEIKKGFTRRVQPAGSPSPWQARFWEHTVRGEDELGRCVDYVHVNPMKHGHSTTVADWKYSTFHRYVREGKLQADWAGAMRSLQAGEPA